MSFDTVRYTLKYQADAWAKFFKDQTGTVGKPTFRSRFDGRDGFTIPDKVKIVDEQLHIPKIGWCKLRRKGGHPYEDGTPKQVRVVKRLNKWYAVVTYEVDLPERVDDGKVVGVDLNVGQVATSTGHLLYKPDEDRLQARKRRYQRMISRRKKGSERSRRAKRMLAKTTAKIASRRQNWHHQTSRRIADSAHTVVIEDLNTKGMTRSAKGTADRPGKNVKAKAGLNREIQNTGWYQLRSMLAYKSGELVTVNPQYTSQTCHVCGHIDPENRRTQSKFKCVQCGHESNADVNAALNLASGTGASGRERAATLVGPMIRQMESRLQPSVV